MADVDTLIKQAHQVAAGLADSDLKSLITALADTLERRDADAKHWYREASHHSYHRQISPGRRDPLD